MSQFDSLLDFGDSPTPATNGTTTVTTQQNFDEFDPFSPSSTKVEAKTTVDSGNLLVDFGTDSDVTSTQQQNGLNSDPFNGHQFDDPSSNTNPLYEMSASNTNPLYEFENTESDFANEILSAVESNQKSSESNSSNPLYDLSNEEVNGEQFDTSADTQLSPNTNPLYDYAEDDSVTQQYEAEDNSNLIQDGSYDQEISREEYSHDEEQLNNSNQEADQMEEYCNSGGNWETAETVTTSSTTPDGGTVTETIITRTSKSRSRSPEVVETVTEVRKSRSMSPEVIETISEVQRSRSRSPEVVETVTEVRRSRSPEITETFTEVTETVTEVRRSRSRSPEVTETITEVRRSRSPEIRSSSPVIVQDDVVEQEQDSYVQEDSFSAEQYQQESPQSPVEEEQTTTTSKSESSQDGGRTITTTTKKTETVTEVKGGPKGGSSSLKQETTVSTPKTSVQQNGVDTSSSTRQAKREEVKREEVRKTEVTKNMANVATAPPPVTNQRIENYNEDDDDEEDEAVYENVPAPARTDVFREADAKIELELPQLGRASSMKERFLKLAEEGYSGKKTSDKELTPPPTMTGQVEAGVFESQPEASRDDVYRFRDTRKEDAVPEKGKALNTVQRYKEIANREFKGPANKRELTPDRSGVGEYISEPRAEHMTYEERPLEAGIFESKPQLAENVSRYEDYVPDELPEIGTAKSIASRFKEIEQKSKLPPSPANRREVTPDRVGKGEYVTEPRAQHLQYEEKLEAGIYENQPAAVSDEIYRHEDLYVEEPLPQKGYAKNIASRFKEIEKNAHIPMKSHVRQITPPKEDAKNVYENVPADSPVVYKETVQVQDVIPEKGKAKNLASKYKVIEQENLRAKSGNRQVKEFTPPKDERTVFESEPKPSTYRYAEAVVESGILESNPQQREDIYRESDPTPNIEEELPERGVTKNLLSRWKQIENESSKNSPPTPGRYKEFTPPRTDERVKELRSPKTPVNPQNNSVNPNDLPGQYQPLAEPTIFESKPTPLREDLFREADTDYSIGLPKSNKTKKMLSKFQAIQSQAQSNPTSPVKKEETEFSATPVKDSNNKAKKGGFFVAVQNEKCGACRKTVYAMEKVEMNKNTYHRACFRCSQCSAVLTPKTFAINADTMFCTNHYKQLFARKGNYDEGFGRPQHKKKWKSEPNLLADSDLHEYEHEIEA